MAARKRAIERWRGHGEAGDLKSAKSASGPQSRSGDPITAHWVQGRIRVTWLSWKKLRIVSQWLAWIIHYIIQNPLKSTKEPSELLWVGFDDMLNCPRA